MIIITMPLKKDFIIDLLDERIEGNQTFIFKKQDKMKLYFDATGNQQQAVEIIKNIIQSTALGKTLFYNISYEE